MQCPAPAKLNLFLYITARQTDGYHRLQTLYQLLDYGDTLTITRRHDSAIYLLTHLPNVPQDKNLALQAARLLQQQTGSRWGADITIDAKLPQGSGLGAGSSHAATTLTVLNQLWECGLKTEQLQQLGLTLGADVPFFLYGQSAFAQGIGEQLQAVSLQEYYYLIAYPGFPIQTAAIFADPDLKRATPRRPLAQLLHSSFRNDCETVVRKKFPQVEQLFTWLLPHAPSARLTGTGSSVFAAFETPTAAQRVLDHAPVWVEGFVARGINTSPLQQQLLTHYLHLPLGS